MFAKLRSIRQGGLGLVVSALIVASGVQVSAQQFGVETKVLVNAGWHPWYEVKASPQDSNNLLLCGSKWDFRQNALFGFAYASFDSGKTWNRVFEDRNSTWVSEHSCAFGPRNTAYIVSEASKVIDGEPEHHLGTTRLFVSSDAGRTWTETIKTGWADWSTSAVREANGKLLTFYNYSGTLDGNKKLGSSVGLLVFSPEGTRVEGGFFNSSMKGLNYQGVYPSNATFLNDGTVVALYYGGRDTPVGRQYDLGVMRVGLEPTSALTFGPIASSNPKSKRRCLLLADYSLAYDRQRGRLFVVYRDEVGDSCSLMLSTSEDGGRTWAKPAMITGPRRDVLPMFRPSIAIGDGPLGLLWTNDGKWFFSTLTDSAVADSPVEVHAERKATGVVSDSLWTVFDQPGGYNQPGGYQNGHSQTPTVGLNVRTLPGRIWRSSGLAASGNRFHAVFPAADGNSEGLYSATLTSGPSGDTQRNSLSRRGQYGSDVTSQIAVLYGRSQSFDNTTGTLSLEVRLANRGNIAVRTPIRLEVESVNSKVGKVTILNADNGLMGPDAVWDLSRIVSGDQIPPGETTYNTFTLQFHIDLAHAGPIVTNDLLNLSARVYARSVGAP